MTSRAEKIEKIRQLPEQLEKLVAGLTSEQLTTPYNAPEWTIAQNVHHLVDSHINSFVRFKLILTEDTPPLKPYRQEAWAELPDANNADISTSLNILKGLHARWTILLNSLTEAQWKRGGIHPEYGDKPITPDDLLNTYAGHGEGHLKQIQEVLDKMR